MREAESAALSSLSIWPRVIQRFSVVDLNWGLCIYLGKDKGQIVSRQPGRHWCLLRLERVIGALGTESA